MAEIGMSVSSIGGAALTEHVRGPLRTAETSAVDLTDHNALLRENLWPTGVPNAGPAGPTAVFVMRGWCAADGQHETWVSEVAPGTVPPNGHVLTEVTIEAVDETGGGAP